MNYLMFVCEDPTSDPTPAQIESLHRDGPAWVDEMDARGARVFGEPFEDPDQGVTVRVRDRQTILTDGPFVETKEFIAGFDLLTCADLDEAIEVAAKHPVGRLASLELRPFMAIPGTPEPAVPAARLRAGAPAGRERYMLLMYVDGVSAGEAEEAAIMRRGLEWLADAQARGVEVYSHALAHADTATTVRVRDGQTLISDGPFLETKEFVGGFAIVECSSPEEASELASGHPLAEYHHIEVRPFIRRGDVDER